jgi:ribosome-binding factor A
MFAMASHRVERVSEAIREVVAMAVLRDLADPRIQGVTVLSVDVTGDLRNATVHVTVMGAPARQKLALRGLQHAAGFLQSPVAARLQTRFTPILTFKLDEGVKKSVEMSKLIDETLAADRAAVASHSASPTEPAADPPASTGEPTG